MAKISAMTFTQKETILDKLKAEVTAEKKKVAKKIYADFAALGEREKKIVESIMKEDPDLTPKMPPPQSTAVPAFGGGKPPSSFADAKEGRIVDYKVLEYLSITSPAPPVRALPGIRTAQEIFEETKTFKSDFFKGLEEKVREALQNGWQPLGAPYDYEVRTIDGAPDDYVVGETWGRPYDANKPWTPTSLQCAKAYQAMVKYA